MASYASDCLYFDNTGLLNKLRRENVGHYRQLVNMHLTFTNAELITEQLDALWKSDLSISKTSIAENSFERTVSAENKRRAGVSRLFARDRRKSCGLTLEAEAAIKKYNSQTKFIQAAINAISILEKQENMKVVGIFRKSGSHGRQSILREALLRGEAANANGAGGDAGAVTVHDVATVLKNLIRDFPEPLITESHCSVYDHVSEWTKHSEMLSKYQLQSLTSRQLRVVQLLMLTLPAANANFLYRLLRLLKMVSTYREVNKMDEYNLAVVFTPAIFFARSFEGEECRLKTNSLVDLLALVIGRMEEVFQIPRALLQDIDLYYRTGRINSSVSETTSAPSPKKRRTITDGADKENVTPAQTTVSFVDRARSADDSEKINTDTSLAALYAHVQMMPEGQEKRKRLKQFREHSRKGAAGKSETETGIQRQLLSNLKRNVMDRSEKVYAHLRKRRHTMSFSTAQSPIVKRKSVLHYWDSATCSNTPSSCSYECLTEDSEVDFEYGDQ